MKKTTEEIKNKILSHSANESLVTEYLDQYEASIIEGMVLGKLPSEPDIYMASKFYEEKYANNTTMTPSDDYIEGVKYIRSIALASITTKEAVTKPYRELLKEIETHGLPLDIQKRINNLLNEMP